MSLEEKHKEVHGGGNLQVLYQQICDEEWERYGYFRPTGYQARAAEQVGRMVGRILIEEDWMYRRLTRYWPFGTPEALLASARLCALAPAIRGNTKTFYLLRDALTAIRDIERRVRCVTCCARRPPAHEYEHDAKWRKWIFPSRGNGVYAPTCSYRCYQKAQKEINLKQKQRDKERKWLKIAKTKQTEVRKWLRNSHGVSRPQSVASEPATTSQIL